MSAAQEMVQVPRDLVYRLREHLLDRLNIYEVKDSVDHYRCQFCQRLTRRRPTISARKRHEDNCIAVEYLDKVFGGI